MSIEKATYHESKVPVVEAKLAAARQEFEKLKTERDLFALASVTGDRQAEKDYLKWSEKAKEQETSVAALTAALEGAKAEDQQNFLNNRRIRIK